MAREYASFDQHLTDTRRCGANRKLARQLVIGEEVAEVLLVDRGLHASGVDHNAASVGAEFRGGRREGHPRQAQRLPALGYAGRLLDAAITVADAGKLATA